jgi:hypothetical protein
LADPQTEVMTMKQMVERRSVENIPEIEVEAGRMMMCIAQS